MDLLAQACVVYGWTTEACLAMPAQRFFAMLAAGVKLDWQRRNWWLSELCDVAPCALGHAEYHGKLKAIYLARASGTTRDQAQAAIGPTKTRPVMDAADPRTGATLSALFNAVTG